mgnify:CR=1 FL=1
MTKWTCGNESVENINDFSEATKKHLRDNLSKVMSSILSDKYDCDIKITYHSYEEVLSILANVMIEGEKLYGADNYEAKLAYAEKYIKKHNFNLKSHNLKDMVDEALKRIERGEVKKEDPLAPKVSD